MRTNRFYPKAINMNMVKNSSSKILSYFLAFYTQVAIITRPVLQGMNNKLGNISLNSRSLINALI